MAKILVVIGLVVLLMLSVDADEGTNNARNLDLDVMEQYEQEVRIK